jgi:hypothetical protein
VESSFNVSQFKVFSHLIFNLTDFKSLIWVLNFLHSEFPRGNLRWGFNVSCYVNVYICDLNFLTQNHFCRHTTCCLQDLNLEDGGSMFLWNISNLLADYTPSHPRTQCSSYTESGHIASAQANQITKQTGRVTAHLTHIKRNAFHNSANILG